ncbi:MAG: LytTR family DNA-binding domain-containing protein [Parvularculaceae bacterium]
MQSATPQTKPKASALIVDDEHHARRNLELALADMPGWRLAGSCESTAQARNILARDDVDLVLLDIKMPVQNGLDFSRELLQRKRPPLVAFVTAYDKHAVEAFDLFAIDYLLKPFDDHRFALLLARAHSMLELRDRSIYSEAVDNFMTDRAAILQGDEAPNLAYISVRSVGSIERIPIDEVIWIKSAGNYLELHLANRVVMHRCTMNAIERRLPAGEFLRLHRTTIARRTALRRLINYRDSTHSAEIAGGEILPVSERYLDGLRRELA